MSSFFSQILGFPVDPAVDSGAGAAAPLAARAGAAHVHRPPVGDRLPHLVALEVKSTHEIL